MCREGRGADTLRVDEGSSYQSIIACRLSLTRFHFPAIVPGHPLPTAHKLHSPIVALPCRPSLPSPLTALAFHMNSRHLSLAFLPSHLPPLTALAFSHRSHRTRSHSHRSHPCAIFLPIAPTIPSLYLPSHRSDHPFPIFLPIAPTIVESFLNRASNVPLGAR